MKHFFPLLFLISTPGVGLAELPVAELSRETPIDYATEVYPFLKANCLACHNTTKAKADLILESPADMIRGGDNGPAIEPGNAEASFLFTTAAHLEDPTMPPANNKSKAKNLTPNELALLKQWINEGAKGNRVAAEAPKSWSLLQGKQPIHNATLTDDGRFAAVGRGQQVDIYDLRLGVLASSLRDPSLEHPTAHRDLVQSLAFGPDGTLASGGYRSAKLWRRPSPERGKTVSLPDKATTSALSADRSRIAVGLENGTFLVFNTKKPDEKPIEFPGHKGRVRALEFSPDNQSIYSAGDDKTITRHSLTDPKSKSTFTLPSPANSILVVNAGKHLFAGGDDQLLRLFSADVTSPLIGSSPKADAPSESVPKPKPFAQFKFQTHPIVAMEPLNPAATEFAVGHKDGTVIFFSINPQDISAVPNKLRQISHGAPLTQLAVTNPTTPEPRIATAGEKGPVVLWNIQDGKKVAELRGDPNTDQDLEERSRITTIANRLKTYADQEAAAKEALWKAESEKAKTTSTEIASAKRELEAKKDKLAALKNTTLPDDDTSLTEAETAKADAERKVASLIRGRETSARLAGEAFAQHTAALARSLEASAMLEAVKKETESIRKAASEALASQAFLNMSFSPEGDTISLTMPEGGVRVYGAASGVWLEDIAPIQSKGAGFLISERIFLAFTEEKELTTWTLPGKEWQLARALGDGEKAEPFPDRVTALAFHPEGSVLLCASGIPSQKGTVTSWDSQSGKRLLQNEAAHKDTITSIAFSPDGRQFATGGVDTFVKIFTTDSLALVKTFEGHTSHVLDVDWNADHLSLVSSGADLEAKIWDIAGNEIKSKVSGFKKEVSSADFVGASETVLTASGDQSLKFGTGPIAGGGKTFLHTAEVSRDGKTIIAAGEDSVLRVWDAATKKLIYEFPSPAEGASKVVSQ